MTEIKNGSARRGGLSLLRRQQRTSPAPSGTAHGEMNGMNKASTDRSSSWDDEKFATTAGEDATNPANAHGGDRDHRHLNVDDDGSKELLLVSSPTSVSLRRGWPSKKAPSQPTYLTPLQRKWCQNNKLNLRQGSCRTLDGPMTE